MKLLHNYFNPQSGESIITLVNKHGTYTGKAKLHQQDKEYKNQLCGYRLAQKRAWVKYLYTELRRKKIMLKTIQTLNQDIQINCKNIDPKIQRRINLKLRDYNNEILELNTNIKLLKEEINKDIEMRDKLIQRSKADKNIN